MTDPAAIREIRKAVEKIAHMTGTKLDPWTVNLAEKAQEAGDATNDANPKRGPGRPRKTA